MTALQKELLMEAVTLRLTGELRPVFETAIRAGMPLEYFTRMVVACLCGVVVGITKSKEQTRDILMEETNRVVALLNRADVRTES